MKNESLNLEIWSRLTQGKSLEGLSVDNIDGRVDLRCLELPAPEILRRFQSHGISMAEIAPSASIHNAKWQNLDFTGSKMNGLRLFGCELSNCLFERCQLRDLRVWATTFTECSFKKASLREAALGGVQDGKRNIYSRVDFTETDLRGTAYKAAAFDGCIFRNAKIEGIDFNSSTFTDCIFEGELRDVLFYRRGYGGEAFPENEMLNVDFSHAKLRDVAFRGLSLEQVKLPEDVNHIMIRDVSATLDKLIAALKQEGDTMAKQLIAFLNIDRKWIVPNQAQAVINAQDLAETLGVAAVHRLRELLQRTSQGQKKGSG